MVIYPYGMILVATDHHILGGERHRGYGESNQSYAANRSLCQGLLHQGLLEVVKRTLEAPPPRTQQLHYISGIA